MKKPPIDFAVGKPAPGRRQCRECSLWFPVFYFGGSICFDCAVPGRLEESAVDAPRRPALRMPAIPLEFQRTTVNSVPVADWLAWYDELFPAERNAVDAHGTGRSIGETARICGVAKPTMVNTLKRAYSKILYCATPTPTFVQSEVETDT